jgi:hypothetical protein
MNTNEVGVIAKVNDAWNAVSRALSTLDSAPAYMLVFLSCLAVGWTLKRLHKFPNEGIPVAVMLWGALFNGLMADPFTPDKTPFRIWLVKNATVGFVIGFGSWLVHRYIWKPALRKARTMFPQWFDGDDDSDPAAFDKSKMKPEDLKP